MFTLFHFLRLIGVIAGIYYGWSYGRDLFGILGAIVCAIVGLVMGNFIGFLPQWLVLKSLSAKLHKMSEDELRASIRNPECFIVNLTLLELKNRGLNINNHISDVLAMLRCNNSARRGFGWAALKSAFPELVKEVTDYRVSDSVEKCTQNTKALEKYLQ